MRVNDKIIDSFELKKSLNPDYFDKKEKMNQKVRRQLLYIAKSFLDFVGVPIKVKDVTLTGSLASRGYSDYSDADLHIIFDPKSLDMLPATMRELFAAKQALFNKTYDPMVFGHEAELYFQHPDEKHASQNVYSVLKDQWVKQERGSKKQAIKAEEIVDKAEQYRRQVDYLEARFKEGDNVTDEIDYLKKKLRKARQDALEGAGEYSVGNLAFKYLRRDGTLERLKNLQDKSVSRKLSLSEGMRGILKM